MPPKKRSAFTLLEVLIASGLVAMLGAVCLYFFKFYTGVIAKTTELKQSVLPLHTAQINLSNLFDLTCKSASFYLEEDTLHFTIDQGTDLDPDFVGRCKAALHLKDRALTCTLSSIKNPDKSRSLVILKPIKDLNYTFIAFGNQEMTTSTWPKDKKSYPDIIKFNFTLQKVADQTLLFFLTTPQILLEEESS